MHFYMIKFDEGYSNEHKIKLIICRVSLHSSDWADGQGSRAGYCDPHS
jgi:hypothetical protein